MLKQRLCLLAPSGTVTPHNSAHSTSGSLSDTTAFHRRQLLENDSHKQSITRRRRQQSRVAAVRTAVSSSASLSHCSLFTVHIMLNTAGVGSDVNLTSSICCLSRNLAGSVLFCKQTYLMFEISYLNYL